MNTTQVSPYRIYRYGQLFLAFTVLMALAACAALPMQVSEPAATDLPQVNIPNPASLYCVEKGNHLEIRTAADGSQSGVCEFPDGTACEEWAYYRGECGRSAQQDPTPSITLEATTDTSDDVPAGSDGAQENDSGSSMPPETTEEVADWWGVIESTQPGAEFDDYFERRDSEQIIYLGIDSLDPAVKARIKALRDSGQIVHLYGTLLNNVPDCNGSQVQVDRIEVME
jgi:putative hemolysin